MNRLLIKQGRVINSTESFFGDVLIEDGIIKGVGSFGNESCETIVDASGLYVIPGGIDPHVHFDLQSPSGASLDDFYSGGISALYGGTTTIFDFVTPTRGENLISALQERKQAASVCPVNYGLHMSPTSWNSEVESQILECSKKEGLFSFKTYLAYTGSIGIRLDELEKIMCTLKSVNGVLLVHCEDDRIILEKHRELNELKQTGAKFHAKSRPAKAEIESVREVINLSAKTGCTVYIVHVSSGESLQLIKNAADSGVRVFAETCPQYLIFNESVFDKGDRESLKYTFSPPLRTEKDRKMLMEGLADGSISVVATDHCPFSLLQKEKGINNFRTIPNGIAGVESRLQLLFTLGVANGLISENRWVELVSTAPAGILGIGHRKGKIAAGYDADIVIWNPSKKGEISNINLHGNTDYSVYEGFKTKGDVEAVILNGAIAVENGKLMPDLKSGDFLSKEK